MERAYWLAWSKIKDVGPVLIKRLHEQFGTLATAWQADAADLLNVDGIGLVIADQIVRLRSQINPHQLLEQHETKYPQFWTPTDPDYPKLLWEIPDPPPVLYYRGPWRPNRTNLATIGIVGTRHPSPYGRRWTQRLTERLNQQQITVVSGLAAGIDAYAHQSCLDSGGKTIAVLGTGVDIVYPRSNTALYRRILENGLIVSEYPDGTPPDRSHFPRRNRIIAGLSHAILVTEAPERSGALITAYLANDYGRQVYALPDGLDNPTARGCLNLIMNGATMVLEAQQLIDDLINVVPPADAAGKTTDKDTNQHSHAGINDNPLLESSAIVEPSALEETSQQIFQMVSHKPIGLDKLQQTTQLDTSVLLSGLLQLELAGMIIQLPGGTYQRQ
ncbi:MAG: DNA-processing protein DprA [Cyanobacteria bacterium P01_D01_bin.156]